MARKVSLWLLCLAVAAAMLLSLTDHASAWPSVYPRGITINDTKSVEPGYILFYPQAPGKGTMLMDNRTGKIVKEWKHGGSPPKLLPNGNIFLSEYLPPANPAGDVVYTTDLAEFDFDGKKLWQFKGEVAPGKWVSWPYHHDFLKLDNGNVLVLAAQSLNEPKVSDKTIRDDVLLEVTPDGKVIWQMYATELFEQYGFTTEQKKLIYDQPGIRQAGDWAHWNDVAVLPQNKWYRQGDQRFRPGLLVAEFRDFNTICIIDRETRKIVWKLGPNYPDGKVDQILGPHDAHMIPEGFPGAGNILVFDNGGEMGYPKISRAYSRVIEIDPVKKEVVWEYNPAGFFYQQSPFYSQFTSNAQRLPNGNTFIAEGWPGRLFEVTREGKIVWEYLSPWVPEPPAQPKKLPVPFIYRAYKYPIDYCPQFKSLN